MRATFTHRISSFLPLVVQWWSNKFGPPPQIIFSASPHPSKIRINIFARDVRPKIRDIKKLGKISSKVFCDQRFTIHNLCLLNAHSHFLLPRASPNTPFGRPRGSMHPYDCGVSGQRGCLDRHCSCTCLCELMIMSPFYLGHLDSTLSLTTSSGLQFTFDFV